MTLTLWDKPKPREGGYVACEAWPGSREIGCWREFLNGERYAAHDKAPYAAHEVCHLAGIWDEAGAEWCAYQLVVSGVCK